MLDQSEKQLDNSNKSEAPECLNLLSVVEKNVPASQSGAPHKDQLQYPKMEAHPGSYYHKVYSPCGSWTGIEGVVTLGEPHLDPKRIHKGVAQDSFSTYLGGHAKKEIDAGLSWEVTTNKHGKVDAEHKAWRPFWRNDSWHSGPSEQRYYWHPGETVAMSLHVVAPNKLQLTISDLGDHPKRKFTTMLDAKGFGDGTDAFFKRVDAIDQNGTEGKHVHKSHSHISGTSWKETVLRTKNGDEQPLVPGFKRVVDDPPEHVNLKSTHQQQLHGGETIDIDAAKKK